jgi:hypothetical protein
MTVRSEHNSRWIARRKIAMAGFTRPEKRAVKVIVWNSDDPNT